MAERRPLGDILLESGRITDDDVRRVLEYQREHGGFFGQAMVALGVVSREEIDWALASQFDLPFIFPSADAVDRDAARLVPADWALAHLAVPIMRAGRTLTVVVADPLGTDTIAEVRSRTGLDVDMALASAFRIRELIHAVYGTQAAPPLDDMVPSSLEELIAHALEHGADRFGVSIRGTSAMGWWHARSESHRVPLSDGWEGSLGERIQPSPLDKIREAVSDPAVGGHIEWDAALHRADAGAGAAPLAARALAGVGGAELLFRVLDSISPAAAAARIELPTSLITELQLLWRGGSARVGVGAARVEVARAVLPLLPSLGLGAHSRAVHIDAEGEGAATCTVRAGRDPAFAATVASYELDALTIDLPAEGYPVRELLRAAPLTFLLLDEPEERAAPGDWGINWLLTIAGQPGSYAWDLRALHR
jgi:hypothetical protein